MGIRRGQVAGLGPVFAYEWLIAARRWQGYALRSLFVVMLLAALCIVWAGSVGVGRVASFRDQAQLGQSFFFAVIGTQLTLVLLVAPAATAGAICLDRARGSLTHLLVTDLSDVEIVLGKLAARLLPVLGLVGCALPVLAILTLLGGVDPGAVLGAFLITVGLAVLGCSLGLVFSLWASKTHEALLGTYAVLGLWLLGPTILRTLSVATGWFLPIPFLTSDPFWLAFAPYEVPGRVGMSDYLTFLAVTWSLSAVLMILAVWRLRAVASRGEVVVRTSRGNLSGPARLAGRLTPSLLLPGPSLEANPVLWREWHRNRPSRGARVVASVYLALATTFSAVAILRGSGNTAAWVNAFQVSIGLLLLSVTASTSLAEERVRGGLDVLMATPLSTRQIVLGKWLGTFRLVPGLTILPVLVILGTGHKLIRWPGAVLMVAFILASGAAITGLGLGLATWCSRLGRAVGLTITIYVLVAVGWMFGVMMLMRHDSLGEGLIMGSPFFWAGGWTVELCESGSSIEYVVPAIAWTVAYALMAFALLRITLLTFDRCLGRVEVREAWQDDRDYLWMELQTRGSPIDTPGV